MAKYIEREAAVTAVLELANSIAGLGASNAPVLALTCAAVMVHDIAPVADLVEVVRCKDCKYSTKLDNEYGHNGVECALFCEDFGENDFCSYGERRYGNATEAEPVKHGQWKYIGVWMCSNCGEGYRLPSGCKPVADCKMHSCPNCGAKMDGVT